MQLKGETNDTLMTVGQQVATHATADAELPSIGPLTLIPSWRRQLTSTCPPSSHLSLYTDFTSYDRKRGLVPAKRLRCRLAYMHLPHLLHHLGQKQIEQRDLG